MKLIVINDGCGHTWAVKDTPQIRARILLDLEDTGYEIEEDSVLEDFCGRSYGGRVEIIDTDNLAKYPECNPFN